LPSHGGIYQSKVAFNPASSVERDEAPGRASDMFSVDCAISCTSVRSCDGDPSGHDLRVAQHRSIAVKKPARIIVEFARMCRRSIPVRDQFCAKSLRCSEALPGAPQNWRLRRIQVQAFRTMEMSRGGQENIELPLHTIEICAMRAGRHVLASYFSPEALKVSAVLRACCRHEADSRSCSRASASLPFCATRTCGHGSPELRYR